MIDVTSILTAGCTVAQLPGISRKRVLEQCSDLLAAQYPNLSSRKLFESLTNRERLGSTAIGEGVAIPHCRTDCDAIVAAFFQLDKGIDYDAPDGQPVDLLFVMVVPEHEQNAHLDLLAILARSFSEPGNRRALRACTDDAALHEQMQGLLHANAA